MSERTQPRPSWRERAELHEPVDLRLRGVWIFAGVLILSLILAHIAAWLYMDAIVEPEREFAPPRFGVVHGAAPRLRSLPSAHLRRYRAQEHEHLQSFGLVDRERGRAHVPLDFAIREWLRRQEEGR